MKVKYILLAFTLLLGGCLQPTHLPQLEPRTDTATVIEPTPVPPISQGEDVFLPELSSAPPDGTLEQTQADNDNVIGDMYEEDIDARTKIGLTDDNIVQMMRENNGRYHFDRLLPSEQRLYVEILTITETYSHDIIISTMESAHIEKIFQCVLNDHPEIFYAVGYGFKRYSTEGETVKISFSATYGIGVAERERRKALIDAYVAECLGQMAPHFDDYEKTKFIYEYLINNTEYDLMAADNQNICSVFIGRRSVCQGYAKATQYLLNAAGIPATLVTGQIKGGDGHAWNIALLDGAYYHIDTTFGDSSFSLAAGGALYGSPGNAINDDSYINHDFLNLTTKQIERTHIIDPVLPIVECTATKDNYYIREGLYFDSVDTDKLQAVFNRAYERQSKYISLKCSDDEVYADMLDFLLDGQMIFDYLQDSDGVVRYLDSADRLSISFWL